jgi:hypothetical protein
MPTIAVVIYLAYAIWVTCFLYDGKPTDERWEWSIGTADKIEGTGTYDE